MLIAILNDTHAGAKNGSDVMLDYQTRFYRDIFFPYLRENGIRNIIHLGDYYDNRRVVNFKTTNQNRKNFLDVLRKEDFHMDIIPGNHDVAYKNTNELCSLKELMGHYTDCVSIHMEPAVLDFEGTRLALLPWITAENETASEKFIQTCDAQILLGHLELAGFKFMANSSMISSGHLPELFDRFEDVYSGHYHTRSSSGNVTYLGSQMEFTWSDSGDPKFFHIFDTDTRTMTPVRNPLILHTKLIYNENDLVSPEADDVTGKYIKIIIITRKDHFAFDKYLDRIQSMDPLSIAIIENFDDIQAENIEEKNLEFENTQDLLSSYIDQMNTDYDRNTLKKIVNQLFIEAQDTDNI